MDTNDQEPMREIDFQIIDACIQAIEQELEHFNKTADGAGELPRQPQSDADRAGAWLREWRRSEKWQREVKVALLQGFMLNALAGLVWDEWIADGRAVPVLDENGDHKRNAETGQLLYRNAGHTPTN